MSEHIVNDFQKKIKVLSTEEILNWSLKTFGIERIALASSLGAEDQVLTDMIIKSNPHAVIFTLDTGRLPEETYRLIDKNREKYGLAYRVLFPDYNEVETMVSEFGQNLFYESVEKRKQCCAIRKVHPLRRALKGLSAWICGLRKEQTEIRSTIEKIEWDKNFELYKINPLAEWTEDQVWEYIRNHHVPYNALHDQGYPTIGCAPCTRPVQPDEQIRAGRWWWESPEHKECGLHAQNNHAIQKGT